MPRRVAVVSRSPWQRTAVCIAAARRLRRERNLNQVEIPEDNVTISSELLGKGGFGSVFIADYNGRNAAAKVSAQGKVAEGGGDTVLLPILGETVHAFIVSLSPKKTWNIVPRYGGFGPMLLAKYYDEVCKKPRSTHKPNRGGKGLILFRRACRLRGIISVTLRRVRSAPATPPPIGGFAGDQTRPQTQ